MDALRRDRIIPSFPIDSPIMRRLSSPGFATYNTDSLERFSSCCRETERRRGRFSGDVRTQTRATILKVALYHRLQRETRRGCAAIAVLLPSYLMAVSASPALGWIWVVDASHAPANDAGNGTAERPFGSINAAAQVAQPGDTVRVATGIYRERVSPARGGEPGRPITYEATQRGTAIVRGSDVFAPQWDHDTHAARRRLSRPPRPRDVQRRRSLPPQHQH